MNDKDIALFLSAVAVAIQNDDERMINRARAILTGKPDPFPDDPDIYYSVETLAKMTGISERAIFRQMEKKELKSFKIGERKLTTKKDWDAFIQKRKLLCS